MSAYVDVYRCSQLRSYSNHSQDTGCTTMDDIMTKANDVFPTQTQIENLNSSAEWLECATCPCNKQTLCKCHTRGQEPRPHKEFTTAGNIHLISNTPPRCEAIRHSATRFEISNRSGVSDVMSVHPYATSYAMQYRVPWMYPPAVVR